MNIGVPKERRPYEYRVGLPPAGARLFAENGHTVYVEQGAGAGAGYSDEEYLAQRAKIVYTEEEVLGRADLVLKISRPLREELPLMREGQAIAGFLHLSASRQERIDELLQRKITTVAYEQIEEDDGYKPVLTPLSRIGGIMAVQVASWLMQNNHGGPGILFGGIAGVPSAEVVIIGGGVVGGTAASAFASLGAHVTVLDIDLRRLQDLQERCPYPLVTMLSTPHNIARACSYADVLVGAVLVTGQRAPTVVTRKMVASMQPRSIILDISIDQGGCVETSRPTNHGTPSYVEEGVIHYCVPNMSGVLGRTASQALFTGAYPFLEALARQGVDGAIAGSRALERGVNTRGGEIVHLKRLGELGVMLE